MGEAAGEVEEAHDGKSLLVVEEKDGVDSKKEREGEKEKERKGGSSQARPHSTTEEQLNLILGSDYVEEEEAAGDESLHLEDLLPPPATSLPFSAPSFSSTFSSSPSPSSSSSSSRVMMAAVCLACGAFANSATRTAIRSSLDTVQVCMKGNIILRIRKVERRKM